MIQASSIKYAERKSVQVSPRLNLMICQVVVYKSL